MALQGGFGAVLKVMISTTLTVVTNLKEVEFPVFEKILAEATGHDATGGWTTYVDTGKRKLNSFKVKLGWDKSATTHAAMLTAFTATTALSMSVQDPAATEIIAFSGFIQKVGRVAEQEEEYVCNVEIQPTGAPTITP